MECIIGIAFKDYVLLAADMSTVHSIVVMKEDEIKLHKLSEHLVMAAVGESGDKTQFAEYIAKNIQLYKMRNGYGLDPAAAAHYTRKALAEYLRSRTPYAVNMLLGGYDKEAGASLHFVDYLASLVKVKYYAFGYGGYVSLSVIDRYYKDGDLTPEEGYDLMKKCVIEIQKRLVINLPNFKVQLINKDGIMDLPNITAKTLALEASNAA
ncbi:proteasome subunit beta type-2-like [Macrosteles quadrilineatus]|uniref:proteasome subunit beta type-2-like n=1 Tax=Macrosteles quadrilineatus TaxID=74068 RepID=UPI0023E2B3E5|nr:proteasome subunit beta type-2-like [Macrosteles quadrilineatus]